MASIYDRLRSWGNEPAFRPDVPDAPSGSGGWARFWRGFQQGINPTRQEALLRGPSLPAYIAGGLQEGIGDWWRGRPSRAGSPLPEWMSPNFMGPDPSARPNPMGSGYVPPDFSGLVPQQGNNDLYGQGQGMMRAPPPAPTRGVGTRGGEVVARGQAARDFVEGYRNSLNQQMMQQQARNAMQNMFRGSEE